ncbi:MAG: prolyl oligopeptidase family serine peptidase [Planctomycetota bacterium]|jgi:dipeptidyl aminopeptidase/acylaminoacyl peptidase
MKIPCLLFSAAATLSVAIGVPPAGAQGNDQIISREILFGNPTKANPRISPDGTHLSFLAPVNNVLNVWVGPIDDPGAARPVTRDTGRGIRIYFWAYTNEHILFLQDDDGDENWRLYCTDLSTGEEQALTPATATAPAAEEQHEVTARIQHVSYKFPRDIVVGLNDRDPQYHDLYVINIDTGERAELQRNEGFLGFQTDDDYNVRIAARLTPDGGNELLTPGPDGDWKLFAEISMEDLFTTGPIDFDKDGTSVYMVDSRGRDTAALKSINLETGSATTHAKDRDADISGGILIHPTEKHAQAASSTFERRKWHVIDKKLRGDFKKLQKVADGELSVINRSLDDMQWIVAFEMDDGPVRYYRYDRGTQDAHFLFTNRSELEGIPLAKMHPEVIKSRDRQSLVSYYTLPLASDPAGKGRPNEPLPMVLWVHGGPWWRDSWGYNPVHQWLANRGYAVLSVNFRGSTGFGKKFVNAANKEWGGKMHDDLIDAVRWSIKKRIADPNRVAIMGGSYGGYATLVGMTLTPETFACGVDIVGPSNLVTFLETIPPYWQPTVDLWATRVGDHRTEDGRTLLTERSPLTYVDKISKPLLIGHGANDPRVKQSESDQIVKTMERENIPVTYALFPDEGHGFARPENRMSFFAVAEAFLSEHLGGRYEPIGDDFIGSSITIPVGADQIAGIQQPLGSN